ncbi:hypothetical protein [Agrobacterium tumefaciens]|uniref:hypothetical protein n=1 Tax=Agrobacterium tumefaciens TaxID=358 RepID=UPI00157248A3|nr:hypothetical protein [Agrobacterium tumefaciens]NSX93151.1 hypothetical protein [Agrobacterium tumefaciens]
MMASLPCMAILGLNWWCEPALWLRVFEAAFVLCCIFLDRLCLQRPDPQQSSTKTLSKAALPFAAIDQRHTC